METKKPSPETLTSQRNETGSAGRSANYENHNHSQRQNRNHIILTAFEKGICDIKWIIACSKPGFLSTRERNQCAITICASETRHPTMNLVFPPRLPFLTSLNIPASSRLEKGCDIHNLLLTVTIASSPTDSSVFSCDSPERFYGAWVCVRIGEKRALIMM